jgi:hypothetical protein
MRCSNSVIAASAALVALVAPYSEAQVFTASYEGDALPQASVPPWDRVFNEGSESVSGGILTVSTPSGSASQAYYLNGGSGLAWDPTGGLGSTIDLRLKVDSQDGGVGTAGACNFVIATGSQAWIMQIGSNVIGEKLAGGPTPTIDTTDAFHVYRFTVDGVGGPLNLYVDGGQSPLATWAGVGSGTDALRFGDDQSSVGGQVQCDYIRWTNAGAFAPVPEPSLLSLAGIGCMSMLRKRRAHRK